MDLWESRMAIPGGRIAHYQLGHQARYFKLVVEPIKHHLLPELAIEALGYNGTTPGPLVVLRQGEWVFLEVENRMEERTALHVHGLAKPNSQDGMAAIEPTPFIEPGQSYTYQFIAWQSGTFLYHSSDVLQVNKGLIGGFVVLPQDLPYPAIPHRDYVIILQQWQIPQTTLGKVYPGTYKLNKFNLQPNFFTINGKSFPATKPLITRYGEKVRMRFINKSSSSHSMHVHGHDFQVVSVNGFPRQGIMDDTINVASGQRWDVEMLANNPGIWVVNGTKSFHQTNNGEAPGGMTVKLIYTE